MAKIQEGDYVLYHSLAEKNKEKSYPQIVMTIIKVCKVNDFAVEDKDRKVYEKYRCSCIFTDGIKSKIENDDYDEERVFKEDLEELIND